MDLAQQLCLWADELRAVASNGLRFNSNPYDRANYERIGHIAAQMFARAVDRPVEKLAPILAKMLGQATPLALDMGWFAEDALPPLDRGHDFWVPLGFRFWRGETERAYFDLASPGLSR